MNAEEARRRLTLAAVGRLATVTPTGRPHIVPICFVVEGDTIYNAVDDKPKRSRRLQRLANVAPRRGAAWRSPGASVLVDYWSDDWTQLWWVRADGSARVVGVDEREVAHASLRAKYAQYATHDLGPVVAIDIDRVRGWAASE